MRSLLVSTLIVLLPASFARSQSKANSDESARHFVRQVLPVFLTKCFTCHGDDPKDVRGELDMRSRAGLLKGGESGKPSLVPGDLEKSQMIDAIEWKKLKMPPKENDRLIPEQVAAIKKWVAEGASWPDDATIARIKQEKVEAAGVQVKTSGGLTDDWTNRRYDPADLWAYQSVKKPAVPGGSANPIDAFLNAKLATVNLKPSGLADRRTLIRRATYDLTGLPPTPEEIDAFLKESDETPQAAYEKLIDCLLASPHYGEQAARHWLDVVRYADSAGFSNDHERPHAWRFRDHVVRSFNSDKPFDRFILEQIAGDELDPKNPEMLIAIGYLRMGPWEYTGMSVAALTRQQFLDDATNNIGEAFLATGLTCCRCHDHKFDPMPTRDYYRMQAVLAPAQFADMDVPFLPTENTKGMDAERERIASLQSTMNKDLALVFAPDATDADREGTANALKKILAKRKEYLDRQAQRFKPLAMSIYNGPLFVRNANITYQPPPKNREGEVQPVSILIGGSLEAPGDRVEPGVLSVVQSEFRIPNSELKDGRRLTLAKWIADPANPLTARVLVNRIWQQHFGKGIAGNPNNFGKMGKKPSHPEFLDWLAASFVENGWSIKKLHRAIMLSEAYQRSGEPVDADATAKFDPDNVLLGHYPARRLSAEELRDATLAVSGELNRELGGLPIRPDINREVAFQPRHVMGSTPPAYQPSRTPEERNRRSLYALKLRTMRDPQLEVFDQPSPDVSCEKRNASTITPQVFSLFNGETNHDRALAFARRLEKEGNSTESRVERAFLLAFGRKATEREVQASLKHVEKMVEHHKANPVKPIVQPAKIIRELVEEQTGKKVRWEERLDVYENFVSDLKPWDVGPETRALADFCLVLFNANEFIYVP